MTGVTSFPLNPNDTHFGAHVNSMAAIFQEFHFEEISLLVYPNGLTNVGLAFAPVTVFSTITTLGEMSQLNNYTYGNQYIARPWRLILRKSDLNKGLTKWYACNTSFPLLSYQQGQIYVYNSTTDSYQIRIEFKLKFRGPTQSGFSVNEEYGEEKEAVLIKEPVASVASRLSKKTTAPETPMDPAD